MSKFCYLLSIILFLANIFGLINISLFTVFFPIFLLWLIKIVVLLTIVLIAVSLEDIK